MNKINNYVSKFNIILLAANLTILGAIFISKSEPEKEKNLNYQTNTNLFIKKELCFSEEQYEQYLELNKSVMIGYSRVDYLTCKNHYQFLLELSKDQPSLAVLDSISRINGRLHTGTKIYTARHFLNIKSICTPEQELKLQKLIKEMLQIGTCNNCADLGCDQDSENEVID